MAPEVLRGYQYTKAADIYSFGIVMNEFLSEEIPFNDIPHDEFLAIKICKGLRPTISEGVPKLLADLIVKCWNAEIKNGPTTKELYQTLNEWNDEISEYSKNSEDNKDGDNSQNSEIYFQIKEYKSKSFQTHPQAFYISRLLNFKNLPKPVNSSDLSSCHFSSDNNYTVQSTSANPISECLDVQLSELELNEICQDSEHNIE
ncbi:kinase-like domain-containing protein [Rhizophagus irregularis DAOM 181602=DAOM 197198]|uniref:Kinase-like domain-containing protein n=1 Tax=Rhizophagus irregularis (strain DAOM 181602 / DAOM 197198 / MUCL 43194) TaxID=747089 RepID=A0A2P4QAM8_RHIID|nr:kinase-like domain-containing protein [Rhizophagus irregularis DAOM 181602=DAOM 197198]POG74666.1 kinase-like domain-containing protein [Rhizophagus irregularis DAOM 181602=DAOM 197198]|eukprot:XP_025181532.1 kinase-like domain-containing protein [Rhizophagus irregularis DAOM 181602=DAOM 197198]